MKNLVLTFLAIMLVGCSEEDTETAEQLPAITTVGANTAGCLVNGKIFLPRRDGSTLGQVLSCFYQYVNDGYHFGLSIVEKKSEGNKSVSISLNPEILTEGTTYILTEVISVGSSYNSNFGRYIKYSASSSDDIYYTTSIHKGELKIIKLDSQRKIISGTFWYDAVNTAGEKVEIRDGRFDMRYVN